jgi:tRNA dimethylallyltransferase
VKASGSLRPLLIGGPTASGKSALALAIAERDRSIVLNADALQVYAAWRVLTARPDEDDLARVPHALYGHVGLSEPYSVGRWLGEIKTALDAARDAGRRPIIVGGTGLYLSALTEGLAPIPAVDPDVRRHADDLVRAGRLDHLRRELQLRDPATWDRIDRNNPARVQRAWEVLQSTGRSLAAWQDDGRQPVLDAHAADKVIICPDPQDLAKAIEDRFDRMLRDGAMEECRAVLPNWTPELPGAKAVGAPQIMAYLRGETSLEAAKTAAIIATRQLAKRQRTWFRSRMSTWTWHQPDVGRSADLARLVP